MNVGCCLLGASMQGDCPTPGCTGIGHVKGAKYTGHHRYGLTYHYMAQNGLPS